MKDDKLLKLADFLDSLPEEKFDFGVFGIEKGKPMLEALAAGATRCGTVGCAFGWAPAVFPSELEWVHYTDWLGNKLTGVQLKNAEVPIQNGYEVFGVAMEFFGLPSMRVAEFLFMPDSQSGLFGRWEHFYLLSTATPKEVADNIRHFVSWYKENPNDPNLYNRDENA